MAKALLLGVAALLGFLALGHSGQDVVQLYVPRGSDILIPGVEMVLKGERVLKWTVEKTGGAAPVPILSYYYETTEAEVQRDYEHRVSLSFTNGSLVLFNATIQDSGRYTLNLIFEGKTYVHVLQVVEPISEMEVETVCSPSECNVSCKASGDVWNMIWKTNGRELTQNITGLGNILTLTIKVDSSDTYTCVALNPVSELEKIYALENYVPMSAIGLLIAALTFSIPKLLFWTTLLLSKFRCCHNAKPVSIAAAVEWSVLLSWLLFLGCSLISASFAQSVRVVQSANAVYRSTVPYGWPVFKVVYLVLLACCLVLDILLILRVQILRVLILERCRVLKGPLKIVNIVLQLCTEGLSIAALIYYFNTYFSASLQTDDFAVTILSTVLAPAFAIGLVYCVCRYSCLNGLLGDDAATNSLDGKHQHKVEMKLTVNNATYTEVVIEDGFDGL